MAEKMETGGPSELAPLQGSPRTDRTTIPFTLLRRIERSQGAQMEFGETSCFCGSSATDSLRGQAVEGHPCIYGNEANMQPLLMT